MGPGFGPGSARELMDGETFTGRPAVRGRRHMISAVHYLATMGGLRVLQAGGNAIDAGVAAGLCINVVQPQLAMFGGVAPIVIAPAGGEPVAISGLGRWPRRPPRRLPRPLRRGDARRTGAHGDAGGAGRLADGAGRVRHPLAGRGDGPGARAGRGGLPPGPRAAPGDRPGRLPGGAFARWPSSAEAFLPDGRVARAGRDLPPAPPGARPSAACCDAAARATGDRKARIYAARDLLYRGEMAREIAAFHQANGGLLTEDDLAGFRVQIEPPARSAYRGYDVLTCGPWCQGPTLLLALKLLEGFDLPAMGRGSADYLHTVLEALKLAFADRDAYFGDPDFVDVPLDRLLSADYAAARRA